MNTDTTTRRTVGPVTGAATAGGVLGTALAQILVHVLPYLADVEVAVSVVLTALLALLGGYLVPPQKPAVVTPTTDPNVFDGVENVEEGETVAVPDYGVPVTETESRAAHPALGDAADYR